MHLNQFKHSTSRIASSTMVNVELVVASYFDIATYLKWTANYHNLICHIEYLFCDP